MLIDCGGVGLLAGKRHGNRDGQEDAHAADGRDGRDALRRRGPRIAAEAEQVGSIRIVHFARCLRYDMADGCGLARAAIWIGERRLHELVHPLSSLRRHLHRLRENQRENLMARRNLGQVSIRL